MAECNGGCDGCEHCQPAPAPAAPGATPAPLAGPELSALPRSPCLVRDLADALKAIALIDEADPSRDTAEPHSARRALSSIIRATGILRKLADTTHPADGLGGCDTCRRLNAAASAPGDQRT